MDRGRRKLHSSEAGPGVDGAGADDDIEPGADLVASAARRRRAGPAGPGSWHGPLYRPPPRGSGRRALRRWASVRRSRMTQVLRGTRKPKAAIRSAAGDAGAPSLPNGAPIRWAGSTWSTFPIWTPPRGPRPVRSVRGARLRRHRTLEQILAASSGCRRFPASATRSSGLRRNASKGWWWILLGLELVGVEEHRFARRVARHVLEARGPGPRPDRPLLLYGERWTDRGCWSGSWPVFGPATSSGPTAADAPVIAGAAWRSAPCSSSPLLFHRRNGVGEPDGAVPPPRRPAAGPWGGSRSLVSPERVSIGG